MTDEQGARLILVLESIDNSLKDIIKALSRISLGVPFISKADKDRPRK
jgi:hypothetical protein